ncbi:MAG: tRNA uridine-5-carboxymethylaminomethyl(34) synthesis GTPase MnmE [Thermostichales cyanobacterium SRBZ-1_bins_19]
MTLPLAETIVAIATAVVPGQGSVSIVRLSGSQSRSILEQVFQPAGPGPWHSHQLRYGWMRDPQGKVIDEGMAVWMQAPRSYTTEDVVELHCHGGVMPVQQVLHSCVAAGARLARPGEFTLRAFLGGRIDLTQAESVADLVAARSPWAAQVALAGLQGKVLAGMRELRQKGLELLAELEARLDFEEDLPPLDRESWAQDLQTMQHQVKTWLASAARGSLLRQGLRVAIVGQPNVGKSSLLNLWSGQDRAIVTDLPGTTRDVVESHLVVKGIPVLLLDTAGIRATQDRVEGLGVERARALAREADLVLLVVDAVRGWTEGEEEIYGLIAQRPHLLVLNKCDLADPDQVWLPAAPRVALSTLTGQGLADLEQAVYDLATQGQMQGDPEVAVNERQAALLVQVQGALHQVEQAMAEQLPYDFWTIGLREAVQRLGEITGEEVTESVLDRIFSRFCIGK